MDFFKKYRNYISFLAFSVAIAYASFRLANYYYIANNNKKIISDFDRNLNVIKDAIISKCTNNKKIEKFIPKSITLIQDENINFSVIMLDKIEKKPSYGQLKTDPFAPPFDPDLYISDITNNHALILNKFSLVDYHVIIISKDFVPQNVTLSYKDFYASLLIMRSLDAFCFFNSGQKAGASQKHFHIQAIPYSSMFSGSEFPINKIIDAQIISLKNLNNNKENNFFRINQFNFSHLLYFFQENILEGINNESIQNKSLKLEFYYLELIKKLHEKTNFEEYNMILTNKWMLIVPRSNEKALDLFSLNAIAFLGSFVIKDESQLNEIYKNRPLNILKSVGFPD